jgi:hypothetical protein
MSKSLGKGRGESLADVFGLIKRRFSRLDFIFPQSGRPGTEDRVHPDALTQLERLTERSSPEQDLLAKRLYRLIQFDSTLSQEERFQKTRRDRFPELNEMLAVEIRNAFPPDHIVHVHDIAVSSAISSMELFHRLSETASVHVHASDFFDTLYLVSPPQSRWQVVFNRALAPVQFVVPGLAISGRRLPRDGIAKNFLRWWLVAHELPRAFEILASALYGPVGGEADEARRYVKGISMFDPRCRALARVDSRFTLGREDLFALSSGPYHVIRVMNALSPSLPDSQLYKVLLAIHRALHDGGLLVIGSGGEEQTRATIFRRSTNGFIAIKDMNSGSILRSRIERFRVERSDTGQQDERAESSEAESSQMVMAAPEA